MTILTLAAAKATLASAGSAIDGANCMMNMSGKVRASSAG